jgi:protein-tyrosine-phosphatase
MFRRPRVLFICAHNAARSQMHLHCPFHDPSKLTGACEQRLQKVRKIRDEIAAKIQDWLASLPVEQPA